MTTRGRQIPHWSTLVLGISAVATVVASMVAADALSSPPWWFLVGIVAMSWSYVHRRTRAIAETSAKNLDERELVTRNAAAWWAQGVMLVLGAASALMLTVFSRLDHASAEVALQKSGGIVLSFVIFGAALPTLFVSAVLTATDECGDEDDGRDGMTAARPDDRAAWTL